MADDAPTPHTPKMHSWWMLDPHEADMYRLRFADPYADPLFTECILASAEELGRLLSLLGRTPAIVATLSPGTRFILGEALERCAEQNACSADLDAQTAPRALPLPEPAEERGQTHPV